MAKKILPLSVPVPDPARCSIGFELEAAFNDAERALAVGWPRDEVEAELLLEQERVEHQIAKAGRQ